MYYLSNCINTFPAYYHLQDINKIETKVITLGDSLYNTFSCKFSKLLKDIRSNKTEKTSLVFKYSNFDPDEDITFIVTVYIIKSDKDVCSKGEFKEYDINTKTLYSNLIFYYSDIHSSEINLNCSTIRSLMYEEFENMYFMYKYLTNSCSFGNSYQFKQIHSFDMKYIRYSSARKYKKLNEAFGVVHSLNKAVEVLGDSIYRKISTLDGKNLDMYFDSPGYELPFDTITVHFIYEHDDVDYVTRQGEYLPADFSKTNDIQIYLKVKGCYDPDEIIESTKSCLFHELTHAYEDYNLQQKGSSLLNKLGDTDYALWTYILKNKDKADNKTFMYAYCGYRTNPDEVNAILAQLKPEIEYAVKLYVSKNKDKMQSVKRPVGQVRKPETINKDLVNFVLNRIEMYKQMNVLNTIIEDIEEFSDKDVDKICKNISEILEEEFTKTEFYNYKKMIIMNWHKYQQRFNRNFYALVNEIITENSL